MKSIGDNCAVFGIVKDTECVEDIYRGLDFLQHRGQQQSVLKISIGVLTSFNTGASSSAVSPRMMGKGYT
jgi:glutamine phosphoribosylpyrophosphate amidotransferase